ncbi:HdeD family acid-resistance protein [Stieleria sp. TO1_6]|uniref:HdeD family acid-resistance protein n=1 Tax=Stieleria tagensis TaxID=2956795 RepID=UPI00209BAF5E|nr:HdeD family acid-resistance protein [Stieleria tagensis]MCO8122814.1 HdeD family acid-resistance protein [Stieleria tagensis]
MSEQPESTPPESIQPQAAGTHPILTEMAALWWLPLVRGILMIILGAYALFRPGMTIVSFAQVFGFFLAFDGILAIIAGVTGKVPSRGATILRGVIELLVGLFVFANPIFAAGIAGATIVYMIGFGAIFSGVIEIIAAIQDRKQIEGEGWLILGGVVAILFGILLLIAPFAFGLTMVRVMGAFAIIGGIASIIFAFRLRGLGTKLAAHDQRVGG